MQPPLRVSRNCTILQWNKPLKKWKKWTEPESTFCKILEDELFDHFSRIFQQRKRTDLTIPTEVPLYNDSDTEDQNPFTWEFTPEEVWTRLHHCSNPTWGLDGINYSQWKKNDRGGYALNAVFNAIHRLGYIPQAWGRPVTILINKKGNESDISNWLSITLSNTIAKLYSSILAIRLGRWAARNERISNAPKGLVSVDGCCKRNFALQAAIVDARCSRRQCLIAWLHLTNAFGSISHITIFISLQRAGLCEDAISVIHCLYAINITTICSHQGLTPHISIQAGVNQGCLWAL